MLHPSLPDWLVLLLEEHRGSHALHYPPGDLSDHGPMAYLAMHALGQSPRAIELFARSYRRRLVPLSTAQTRVTRHDWSTAIGRVANYPALLALFDAELRDRGFRATLAKYLPRLISGWVLDLFHPLIRLGYGVEFEVPSEIAAGLAYLACVGDDPALARAATDSVGVAGGRAFLDRLRGRTDPSSIRGPGPFNRRYRQVVSAAALCPADGQEHAIYTELSRACLEVFHATHDFFALHMVTASHAFRLCSPWAGPDAHRIYSVGIGAAYLTLGAPTFQPIRRGEQDAPDADPGTLSDEHDLKILYTCRASGRTFADPSYEWVAGRYLAGRFDLRG
jgi:hypothetical protein